MDKTRGGKGPSNQTPKKKTISEDIKNYAESTMNELLGWYGYESGRDDHKPGKKCRNLSECNDSEGEAVKFTEGCGWCGKPVDENTSVISASATFCSELCFSQSRRASFKRNKTCDWCRHARNTISYVDFQDNAAQLQFCSDKCLNQYKMHIFCRETKAHLELHPHLHGTLNDPAPSGALITPDLWLRNCTSPNPPPVLSPPLQSSPAISRTVSPLPLISITPSSKLLAKNRSRNLKRTKKGCSSTVTSNLGANDIPQDLRVRPAPIKDETPTTEESCSVKTNLKEETECSQARPEVANGRLNPTNIKAILGNILPPPTTFVPYPVILPLPIPIPIPIPIPKMFKSYDGKDLIEFKDNSTQTYHIESEQEGESNEHFSNNNNVVEEDAKQETSEVITECKRLLRKRKRVSPKGKPLLKPKKTSLFNA